MQQARVVVYTPPTFGLPFLVVTVLPDGSVEAEPFPSYDRALARFEAISKELHVIPGKSAKTA